MVNSSIILGQFSYPAEDFLGGGEDIAPYVYQIERNSWGRSPD